MSKFHDFLIEHAKFPFPIATEDRTVGTTDISTIEVGSLEKEWKVGHAVRDDTLVQKLCHTLQDILGDTTLTADSESRLLAHFSPDIQFYEDGYEDTEWATNPSEVQSRSLLDKGFFVAARICLWKYGKYRFKTAKEEVVPGGSSRVDYVALVDDQPKALCEAKSPSVMKRVGDLLPPHGIKLTWVRGQSLVPKILAKAALYLGLRRMEWLFLSCHNYWIVCRLVEHDSHPFLAYSPLISIQGSSEPFRAFLGALLSVIQGVRVESSTFRLDMKLDIIIEDEDQGPLPESDIDDRSGRYLVSSSKRAGSPPLTRSRKRARDQGLMITSSSRNSPASFQAWLHLFAFANNTLALPQSSGTSKPRLWLTRFVGMGSTGNVWQCHFDDSDDLFAVKIVELLRPSDSDRQLRLRNEFNVYLALEEAHQSGRLRDRIAPYCYGAFEGDGADAIILELCNGILRSWDELCDLERVEVYRLVQDLHSIGIVHGDLEPRNVVRVHGGGFRLIDFSESRKHNCKENVRDPRPLPLTSMPKQGCFELQTLRNLLWGSLIVS